MTTESGAVVRTEEIGDRPAVAAVIEAAFESEAVGEGPRVRDLEAALVAGLALANRLSLVAELGDVIVGQVLLTRGWVDAPARLVQSWVLSPVSVAPQQQGRGVGSALVAEAIGRATRAAAARAVSDPERRAHVFLEGDPDYYRRFGFRPGTELGFVAPSVRIPAPAFQVLVVADAPGIIGALVYPDPFWQHDCVGLR